MLADRRTPLSIPYISHIRLFLVCTNVLKAVRVQNVKQATLAIRQYQSIKSIHLIYPYTDILIKSQLICMRI